MALPDALTAIRNRITAAHPTMPIRWPGKRFQVPNPPAMFFVFDFLGSSPVTAGIAASGSHLHREFATFAVHVLVPDGDGDQALMTACQQLADLFRVTSFVASVGQVNCDGEPRLAPLPDDAMEGSWFGRSVIVDFRHDWIG
jgi:hypothetical protein